MAAAIEVQILGFSDLCASGHVLVGTCRNPSDLAEYRFAVLIKKWSMSGIPCRTAFSWTVGVKTQWHLTGAE
jgi:hypothetical protein